MMRQVLRTGGVVAAAVLCGGFAAGAEPPPKALPVGELKRTEPVDYAREIAPVLERNCTACHNGSVDEGGLSLEDPARMRKGGRRGTAIVPGKPDDSLLFKLAAHRLEPIMPPDDNDANAKNLTPAELALLRLWIEQGAQGEGKAKNAAIVWQPLPPGVNAILAAAVTEDGRYVALSRANQVFLHQAGTGRAITRLTDPALVQAAGTNRPGIADLDAVQSIAFSPDGSLLATGGFRTVRLWRRPDNAQRHEFDAGAPLQAAAVSPDGTKLAVGLADGSVKLFDLTNGQAGPHWKGQAGPVTSLRFSADGGRLASGSADKTVLVRKVADGAVLNKIESPAPVKAVAFVGDDTQLVTGGDDKAVRLWNLAGTDPAQPAPQLRAMEKHTGAVNCLTVVPNQRNQVVSGGEDGIVRWWDVNNGNVVREWNHGGPVTAVDVRPDAGKALSAGANHVAKLWNVGNNQMVAEIRGDLRLREEEARRTRELELARAEQQADKQALAAAEKDLPAKAEGLKKAKDAQTEKGKVLAEKQTAATKADDEKKNRETQLAAAVQEIEAAVAAQKAAEENRVKAEAARNAANQAAEAARNAANAKKDDAGLAAVKAEKEKAAAEAEAAFKAASEAKPKADQAVQQAQQKQRDAQAKVQQFDNEHKQAQNAFKAAQGDKQGADRVVEDAEKLHKQAEAAIPAAKEAVAKSEARVKESEGALAKAQETSRTQEKPLRAAAFTADGLNVATAGDAGVVHLWDGETGKAVDLFVAPGPQTGLAAVSDNRGLVSVGPDGKAIVWDTQPEWKLERTLGAADNTAIFVDRVLALAFSRDGQILATGGGEPSRGGELKLFRAADGTLMREIPEAHSDTVLGLAFSWDGTRLASCAADKFVKVFDVRDGKLLKSLEGHTHHVLGVGWQARGKALASSGADNVVKVWNYDTGEQLRTIQGFGKHVTAIAFIGTSDNIATACGDTQLRIHNALGGNSIRGFGGSPDYLNAVAVTPDGNLVAAGGMDSILRIYNAQNGQLIREIRPPVAPTK